MANKRITIDPKVDTQLKKFASIISKNYKKFTNFTKIGEILFTNDSGDNGFVQVFAKYKFEDEGLLLGDKIDELKIYVKASPSQKSVYNGLYHEMLHATDPEFFSEDYWEGYDPEEDASYYGHNLEFRTMTNEFLNALFNTFKEKLKGSSSLTKKRLHDSLTNIVNYYLHDEPLTDFSSDLLDYSAGVTKYSDSKLKDFYSRTQLEYPGEYTFTVSSFKREKLPLFIRGYLNKVKEHNPTQWSNFMSTLLSTREEISDLF
jgi:hypothetical protein